MVFFIYLHDFKIHGWYSVYIGISLTVFHNTQLPRSRSLLGSVKAGVTALAFAKMGESRETTGFFHINTTFLFQSKTCYIAIINAGHINRSI